MAISTYQQGEIRRKAENNIALDVSTPEKQAMYDKHQTLYKDETIRKARQGEHLLRPNEWKDGIYQDAVANANFKDPVYYNPDSIMDRSKANDAEQLSAMERMMGQWADSSMASQDAILSQTKDQQIAEIQKALEDAVAEGLISTREAEKQFSDNKAVIEKQAYADSEKTNVASQARGIQNSAQTLGMMASDDARKSGLINENMTTRDMRVNDIKDRLNAIKNKSAIDTSTANATYGYGLAAAQGNIDAQQFQNMFQSMLQNMQTDKNNRFQLDSIGMNNTNQNSLLDKQHNQNKDIIGVQHDNNKDIIGVQHGNNKDIIGVQHGNNKDIIKDQHGNTVDIIGKNQANTVTNQQSSQAHDSIMLSNQQSFAKTENEKNRTHEFAVIKQRHKDTQSLMPEQVDEYGLAMSREYAKHFDPSSQEYKIYEKMQADELKALDNSTVRQTVKLAEIDQSLKDGVNLPPGPKPVKPVKSAFDKLVSGFLSDENSFYAKKVKAYEKELETWEFLDKRNKEWNAKYGSN